MADGSERHGALSLAAPAAAPPVHWLPCKIDYSGPANVETYFVVTEPAAASTSDAAAAGAGEAAGHAPPPLEAALRGRRLRGARQPLPAGYRGVVLAAAPPPAGDADVSHAWRATEGFGALTYWNHDAPPGPMDAAQRALDWLPLAARVHAAIDPDAVEAALAREAAGAPPASAPA